MIAIDVKTHPDRYGELAIEEAAGASLSKALMKSLEILSRADTSIRIEYRTVLVPGLVGEAELRAIGKLIPKDGDWELAAFVPGVCLDPSWNKIDAYGPEETKRLLSIAQSLIPGARLR